MSRGVGEAKRRSAGGHNLWTEAPFGEDGVSACPRGCWACRFASAPLGGRPSAMEWFGASGHDAATLANARSVHHAPATAKRWRVCIYTRILAMHFEWDEANATEVSAYEARESNDA